MTDSEHSADYGQTIEEQLPEQTPGAGAPGEDDGEEP